MIIFFFFQSCARLHGSAGLCEFATFFIVQQIMLSSLEEEREGKEEEGNEEEDEDEDEDEEEKRLEAKRKREEDVVLEVSWILTVVYPELGERVLKIAYAKDDHPKKKKEEEKMAK